MKRPLKVALTIVPWIGLVLFAYLFIGTQVTLGAADHYSAQTFDALSSHNEKLASYVKARGKFANDKFAFQELGLIYEDQIDGKHEPWILTELGLVKFDNEGFVERICNSAIGISHLDCPSAFD